MRLPTWTVASMRSAKQTSLSWALSTKKPIGNPLPSVTSMGTIGASFVPFARACHFDGSASWAEASVEESLSPAQLFLAVERGEQGAPEALPGALLPVPSSSQRLKRRQAVVEATPYVSASRSSASRCARHAGWPLRCADRQRARPVLAGSGRCGAMCAHCSSESRMRFFMAAANSPACTKFCNSL